MSATSRIVSSERMILSGFKFLELAAGAGADAVEISVGQRPGRTANSGQKLAIQIGNVQGGRLLGFFQGAQARPHDFAGVAIKPALRSEERRVGTECRSR